MAWADEHDKGELAKRVIEACNVRKQLEEMHKPISGSLKPYASELDAKTYEQVEIEMQKHFSGSELLKSYEASFSRQLQVDDLEKALQWYDSPLGKKISAMENKSAGSDVFPEIAKYAEGLKKNPAPKSRETLIREYDVATKSTDLFVDIAVNVRRAILIGILSLRERKQGQRQAINQSELNQQLLKMRNALRAVMARNNFITNLYTYREATDDELKAYLAYLKSKPGKNLSEAGFIALNDALQAAAESMSAE